MVQTFRYHQSLHRLNGVHFISATTHHRIPHFSDDQICLILQQQIMFYSQTYEIDLLSFVIMPDHFHCLIWPQGEKTFSDFMRGVKSYSGKKILGELNRRGPMTPPVRKIWQDSFFTYFIDSIFKFNEKLEYIKQNPVEAGLVSTSEAYRWLYVNPKIYEIEF